MHIHTTTQADNYSSANTSLMCLQKFSMDQLSDLHEIMSMQTHIDEQKSHHSLHAQHK